MDSVCVGAGVLKWGLCVGTGWRGLWSMRLVPHCFGVTDAFEYLKNALSRAPFNFGDNFQGFEDPLIAQIETLWSS